MFIRLLLLSTVVLATSSVPVCPPGGIYFNPPQNLSVITRFPEQIFPAYYNCSYRINVPQGLFADFWINYHPLNNKDGNSKVVVTDQSNFSETITHVNFETFYFLSNGGNIMLSTGLSDATFSIAIFWRKLPTLFAPVSIQLNASNTEPRTISVQQAEDAYVITSETKVSILAIPSIFDFDKVSLRGTYIYDGPTWNSTFLGSGIQLWASNKQWVSTGNQLTVQFLSRSDGDDRTRIVLQDYENTKHIVNYQCGYCHVVTDDNGKDCQIVLDNTLGTSAVMTFATFGLPESITKLDGNGTLDVYIGGITQAKSNLLASYSVQNPGLTLPQSFGGPIKTYVLEGVHSKTVLNLTIGNRFRENPVGSTGLVMSNFYSQVHTGQDAHGVIPTSNGQVVTFSFRFLCADMAKNSTLKVLIYSGSNSSKLSYDKTFTATNPPPINKTIQVRGNWMGVYLDSYEGASRGMLMKYEILKGAPTNFCILIFTISLFMRYFQ